MSERHAARFLESGIMPAGKETFISRSSAYAAEFKGTLFEIQLKPGTLANLENIGVRNIVNTAEHPNSYLPIVQPGWKSDNAFFKFETSRRSGLIEVNIGLGNGRALNMFNSSINEFRVLRP